MNETKTVRAFLGLGSNLGNSRELLRSAVSSIPELVAVSPVYETEPVGGPTQSAYLNIVVMLETRRSPHELLELCHELETAAVRVREVRWGPRTLDVDVVYIDGVTLDDKDLTVPHPRAHERNFVMAPLLDLDPTLRLDGYDEARAIGQVTKLGPL